MLEIPESNTIAKQLNESVKGKRIKKEQVTLLLTNSFFILEIWKNITIYLLEEKLYKLSQTEVELKLRQKIRKILLANGINSRYFAFEDKKPKKHQLIIEFEDYTAIVCTVQM